MPVLPGQPGRELRRGRQPAQGQAAGVHRPRHRRAGHVQLRRPRERHARLALRPLWLPRDHRQPGGPDHPHRAPGQGLVRGRSSAPGHGGAVVRQEPRRAEEAGRQPPRLELPLRQLLRGHRGRACAPTGSTRRTQQTWPAFAAAADRRAKYFGRLWTWGRRHAPASTWTARDEDGYRGPFTRRTSRAGAGRRHEVGPRHQLRRGRRRRASAAQQQAAVERQLGTHVVRVVAVRDRRDGRLPAHPEAPGQGCVLPRRHPAVRGGASRGGPSGEA